MEGLESITLNDKPVIGILSMETPRFIDALYPKKFKSYIAASYVKLLEGSGARVIPIQIGKSKGYYRDIVNKTNGVLFPGGAVFFNTTGGYAEAGMMLYNLAIDANKRGDYYPILGICLGMELLMYAEAGGESRMDCSAMNVALPLQFKPNFKKSKMFKDAPDDIIEAFKTKPITANFHKFCITERLLKKFNLDEEWQVTSVSQDKNQLEFISTMESKKYPFFGVQFHPEKSIYEWKPSKGISHMREAVTTSQYLANLFVDAARLCEHKYPAKQLEESDLIWNYQVTYTLPMEGSSYTQCYLFK